MTYGRSKRIPALTTGSTGFMLDCVLQKNHFYVIYRTYHIHREQQLVLTLLQHLQVKVDIEHILKDD
jgi:hypothetical protein